MSAAIQGFGEQIMSRLEQLATCTEEPNGLTRTFLTSQHKAAAQLLEDWMVDAGMHVHVDAIGNVVGRYEGARPGLPALLTGSHFDTVRNAGKYDGMLGIVAAIACVEALNLGGERLPFEIQVVGFADEEGVRFASTLLGSRAVAGTFDPALLQTTDRDGVSMADALRAYGLDAARIADAAHDPREVHAFVELHIEQGPVLESESLPLGVVTSIAGATRFQASATGLAGHAGTVPMNLRRDAAAAAAEVLLFIEKRCQGVDSLVGTVGQLTVPNGAANVIPGAAEFSIDIRAAEDEVRAAAVNDIINEIEEIGRRRNVQINLTKTHDAPASPCAPWLMEQLEAAVVRNRIEPRRLPSGAGHDAMAFRDFTDIAMLFVRCGNGGISHNPAETMTAADAELGACVLLDFMRNFKPKDPPS